MAEKGYNVGVITGYPKEYSKEHRIKKNEKTNNINIKRLNYVQLKRSNFIGRLINYFSFTISVLLKIRYIKKYKAVMVFSNPPILPIIGVISKKLFKTKFIFVSYDVYPEIAVKTNTLTEKSFISNMMNFINKSIFKNVDRVVTLSEEMSQTLLGNRKHIKPHNLVAIPNWDTSKELANQSPVQDNFKHLEKKIVISYFGNLGIAQDEEIIFRILESLKIDNNYHFIFAGHGNKIDDLKEFVKKHNLTNVSIYGFLQGKEFEDALSVTNYSLVSLKSGLHGLAVPSKTYTLLRAGIPVFAAMDKDSDIVKALFHYNAGFHLNQNNFDEVIEKIKNTSDHENYQMKINALKLYNDKYRRDLSTAKYIRVLDELL